MKRLTNFIQTLRSKSDQCTGIEGIPPSEQDDFYKHIDEIAADMNVDPNVIMQNGVLRFVDCLNDLSLEDVSTASTTPTPVFDEKSMEELIELARQLQVERQDLVQLFVITTIIPAGVMLKCRYEDRWCMLINQDDYDEAVANIPVQPTPSAIASLTMIPVIKDDELATLILVQAIAFVPKPIPPSIEGPDVETQ